MMSFQLKASLSVAFNFGPTGSDGVGKKIQRDGREDNIRPALVSPSSSQPQPTSDIQHQTSFNPSRPKLHRFGRFQRTAIPMTANDPGGETESAKAKDRESLKLLIQTTSHTERTSRSAGGNEAMSSGSADYSLVRHVPAVSSSIAPENPSASGLPLDLPYDSGSNLVSSLQRLRIRGLASYFEKMERIVALRPHPSSATLISEGVERNGFEVVVKEDGETKVAELEDWEEMTISNVSQR
jgi:hypothetical protein